MAFTLTSAIVMLQLRNNQEFFKFKFFI